MDDEKFRKFRERLNRAAEEELGVTTPVAKRTQQHIFIAAGGIAAFVVLAFLLIS